MKRLAVLLADDHAIVVEGLRRVLEPEFRVVGVVADGRALMGAAARLRPDSKMVVSRDWPTGEARLNGALQISRGLMRVLAASETRKELEPA